MAGEKLTTVQGIKLPRRWLQGLARLILAFERAWPALWPVLALLLGFGVVASFDLLPALPGWLHATLLGLFGCALVAAMVHAGRQFRPPSRQAGVRRLETDSGLAHRPLATLGDQPVAPGLDAATSRLWAVHMERTAAAARHLRLTWPRAGLVASDPFGIRVGLALLCFIGWQTAGQDLWPRFERALHPALGSARALAAAGYDVWITPPAYTGLPPIYQSSAVAGGGTAPLSVPVGSTLLARVHGGDAKPKLLLGAQQTAFGEVGSAEYSLTAPLKEATSIVIQQDGETLVRLPLHVIPDLPPTAAWRGEAHVTPRAALRLDYAATDDYGVAGATISVTPAEGHDKPAEIEVPLPSHGKTLKETVYEDLTASPWAGLPVELKLITRDAIGQTGISAPMKMTLPERAFHHPVARAIVDQRKLLMRDPTQADIASETLEDLSQRPDRFRNDAAVFLALRAASARVAEDAKHAQRAETLQLLWDTALRVEDGDVPQAQNSLRQAEQALQEALDRNASDAEIEALMRQLQDAVHRYLQAMIADAQRNGAQAQPSDTPGEPTINSSDIDKMLNSARDMAKTGARDAAKQALANLQNLLESLRTQSPGEGQDSADGKALNAMRDLAKQQQDLLDKSYRAAQQQQGGGDGQPDDQSPGGQQKSKTGRGGSGEDLAGAQDGLRRKLDDLMRQMGQGGDAEQGFGQAERAMNGAAKALRQGDPQGAVGQQGEALDQLQQAMQQMASKMGRNGQGGQEEGNGRDPFGRSAQGQMDGGDVKLPTGSEIQRSREILDELRRRASDWQRPAVERDYLNRLLDRF
jgi:uncharacterized protein (TIGR02302 family)